MARRPCGPQSAATFLVPASPSPTSAKRTFRSETTRDLYDLCSAPADHPDYAPAIYSCRAFLEATVQYHDAVSDGKTLKRLICYPSGATLEDARVAFVAWAKANARNKAFMGEMPVMGVVRALEDKYPCKG